MTVSFLFFSFQDLLSFQKAAIGKPAPEFTCKAVHNGDFTDVKLSDYRGKYVVLFFYPADLWVILIEVGVTEEHYSTFVCPTEIIAFSDRSSEFEQIETQVMACSTDSAYTHFAWISQVKAQTASLSCWPKYAHLPIYTTRKISSSGRSLGRDYVNHCSPHKAKWWGLILAKNNQKKKRSAARERSMTRRVNGFNIFIFWDFDAPRLNLGDAHAKHGHENKIPHTRFQTKLMFLGLKCLLFDLVSKITGILNGLAAVNCPNIIPHSISSLSLRFIASAVLAIETALKSENKRTTH